MTAAQLLNELKALGKEQTRKTYARHGVTAPMFGVSYGDLNKFKKKLKINHELAQELWTSGNHDARILATMIADPGKGDDTLLDTWIADIKYNTIADAFAGYAAQTELARPKMERWILSDDEWIGTTGWNVLGTLASRDELLPDAYFEHYLKFIEKGIHVGKNRVRHAMNNALIAIGTRSPALEQQALGVARKIGKVEVDHGETDCQTPDAATYIKKVRDRQKAKA